MFRFYLDLHSQYSSILLQIAAIAEVASRMIFILGGRIRPEGHRLPNTSSDVHPGIDSVVQFYFKPTYFMGKVVGKLI